MTVTPACSLDGCDKPVKRTGLCYGHYMKQWRYGTPTPQHPTRYDDKTGQRFGALVAVAYAGPGMWTCRCDCGSTTQVRSGDLNRGSATSCGCGRWQCQRRDTVGYHTLHQRLAKDRGVARALTCVDCGRPAHHWSYDHGDPDELVDRTTDVELPYSLDADHYDPRCVSCHKLYDLGRPHHSTTHDAHV